MTRQQKLHVDAQKIVEGSPIGVRNPDIISGLSLAKLFDELYDTRQCLTLFVEKVQEPTSMNQPHVWEMLVAKGKKALQKTP